MSIRKKPLRIADCRLRIRDGRLAQSAIGSRQSEIRGFTLIEILLVVVIVTMIAGLGGGYCVGSYKRLIVEKTARQLLLMATYARIMAIEQQRPYELQIDAGNRGFLLATTDLDKQTGETQRVVVRDYYCRPVEFDGDVKFEDVVLATPTGEPLTDSTEEQKVVFLPNGSAESAVLQIGDGKTHYTVAVVAATGKATLSSGTAQEIDTVSIDLDIQ
jgi:prepilin-type N-terminal cleavage/methylation domain-containing protein